MTNASFHLSTMSLEIAPVIDAGPLPACTPSLMPFCISYTGPAPVSRYFRPRPAPPSLAALSVRSSSSATLVASSSTSILGETKSSLAAVSSTTSVGSLAHESECGDELLSKTRSSIGVVNQVEQVIAAQLVMDTAMGMDSETQPALDAVPLDNSSRSTRVHTPGSRNVERFVAAFRGRQMYGQAVDVPNGYGGLVLQAPLDSKGVDKEDAEAASKSLSQKAKPKSKTRAATRRSKRATVDDIADEPERGDDGDIDPPPLARKLVPSSTFTSFMLWTPDRPLDEGRDEYARALVEWTHLATEVSSLQCLLYI